MTKNKVVVDVIMTFGSQDQRRREVQIPEYMMYCKEDFLEWIVRDIIKNQNEVLDLMKISTCVIGEISKNLEHRMMGEKHKGRLGWFMKYKGKFYRQTGDFYTIYPLYNLYHSQGGDTLEEKESKVLSREDGIDIEVKYYDLIHPPSTIQSIKIINKEETDIKTTKEVK